MGGHTQGPWAVSKRGARRVTTTQGVVICNAVLRNSGSPKRGIKHGAKEVLEAEANARLIAAAPAMLEALQMLVADFGDYPGPCLAFDKARAAIAKALGQGDAA